MSAVYHQNKRMQHAKKNLKSHKSTNATRLPSIININDDLV